MTAIQKLIDQTLSWATEAADVKNSDLAKTYLADWQEFNDIAYLMSAGYINAASKAIYDMDTAPREEMVMAIKADYGSDMVHQLGFKLL